MLLEQNEVQSVENFQQGCKQNNLLSFVIVDDTKG